jgi:outer membrane protein OmpA-like peptidoglycan-associated protein
VQNIFGKSKSLSHQESEHWMSVSDLMAGLMMVFLFISIALMLYAVETAKAYQENKTKIYEALKHEFQGDLEAWDAKIDENTLAFRFKSPEVLFDTGQYQLKPKFQVILTNFFPRYLNVLEDFKNSISEVKIEGHTSSVWMDVGEDEAYFKNMNLSQGRTREVLDFVYDLESVRSQKDWVRRHVAAVGYSSSRPVKDKFGKEDQKRSRRVEFRVVTKADEQLSKIQKRKNSES